MGAITHFPTGSLGFSNSHTLTAIIDDISTASSTWTSSLPFDYEVENAYVTIYGAIATADVTLTLEVNGTAIAGMSAVVPFTGSAAGTTVAFSLPSGGPTNEAAEGDVIEIVSDGASDNAVKAIVNISVRRIA